MEVPASDFRFSRRPTGDTTSGGWSLIRAKPKGDLKVICLADDFFGIDIHFFNGRTTPCRSVDCPACLGGMLSRWAGYLPCLSHPKWATVIVEFTGSASADLDGIRANLGTLRGANLVFSRANDKPNGRVRVSDCGFCKEASRLPLAPAVWPIIAKIFRVNANLFGGVALADEDDGSSPIPVDDPTGPPDLPHGREHFRNPVKDLEGQRIMFSENGK